jgi:hypothetical protein
MGRTREPAAFLLLDTSSYDNVMMRPKDLLALLLTLSLPLNAQTVKPVPISSALRVWLQGDTSRLADFVESCRQAFSEKGIDFQVADSSGTFDYNIVVVQESSISGASGAVVALDRNGRFVASVVRAGRWTGKGALNASAKNSPRR